MQAAAAAVLVLATPLAAEEPALSSEAVLALCAAYSAWSVPAATKATSNLLQEAARWAACRRTPPIAQGNAHLRAAFFANVLARLHLPGPFLELGVRRGEFSRHMFHYLRRLRNATSALPRLFLVDTWQHAEASERYIDGSNVDRASQQANLKCTLDNLSPFWPKISLLQVSTQEAAPLFRDEHLGFIYLDARHDYCAVREDLALYWPKLAEGGILAGDDFGKQEWPWCRNGTKVPRGLDLAVEEFAEAHGLRLFVVREQWLIQKPLLQERT